VHIDFAIQEKETTEKMNDPLIQKKILHAGTANASEFPSDTKVLLFFNYQ
jgi:hypothetical protein